MFSERSVYDMQVDCSQHRTGGSFIPSTYPPHNRIESLSNISLLLSSSDTVGKRVSTGGKGLAASKASVVDPYRILGVRRNATGTEIYEAYMHLALLYHPQRFKYCRPAAEENTLEQNIRLWKFIVVSACYETLRDIDYRTNYNFINERPNYVNMDQRDNRNNFAFWDDMKRVLKISDSNEEFLDHEGVPCCHDILNIDRQNLSMSHDETRDENEVSLRGSVHTPIRENSLVKPAMARDESEKTDPGQNSTSTSETDHLFRGPLATLYKARDHEPFTDPICLFNIEFDSKVFSDCLDLKSQQTRTYDIVETISQKWLFANTKDSWQEQTEEISSYRKVYPSLPKLTVDILEKLCNEPAMNSGVVESAQASSSIDRTLITKKKRRVVGKEYIVRTEKVKRDPLTGKTMTLIEVKREPVSDDNSSEMNFSSICSPLPFIHNIEDIFDYKRLLSLVST
jgi:DnaJ-class molecular chaperone with C-terminal Zn finger domain